MKELLDGISSMITSAGIQTGHIYIGYQPATPASTISLYSYGGPQSDSKLPYDTPSVQALVRGVNEAPMVVSQKVYNLLHGLTDLYIGGVWVVSCIGTQGGPTYIGHDRNGYPEYSVNFDIEILNETANRESVNASN